MRIAFIVHDYDRVGGQSRYVAELASRFAREHEVHVYANRVQGVRDPGVRFHHVPALRLNALTAVLTFILPATLRALGGFDIIHAQGLSGLRQNVVTAHICQPVWFLKKAQAMGALTWKQKIFQRCVQPLEKYTFKKNVSQAVIAISKQMKLDLEFYYSRSENVTVIYHGVDLTLFHPDNRLRWRVAIRNEIGITNDKIVALYVGDLQKGALPAIDAIARVEGIRLVCVSSCDPTPYKVFADKMSVGSRVHFLPATDKIERYYAAADIFLFPTLYDSFGMVITEAMAAGLPVITSATAGAAELIEHGISGMVAENAWDAETLAGWLQHLATDIGFRENMGREARIKAEHYTWDDTAMETMRVYQQVVASKETK